MNLKDCLQMCVSSQTETAASKLCAEVRWKMQNPDLSISLDEEGCRFCFISEE